MSGIAHDLSRRLADRAEAVCRHYLSNGRREGRYWLVGGIRNTPGRSLFVRLQASAKGPAGKWTDAATGEHGDLLDIIRGSLGLLDFADIAAEARTFLSLPDPEQEPTSPPCRVLPTPSGSVDAARRLFAMSQPLAGTLAETYLRRRGITLLHGTGNLRFHPHCYYKPDDGPTETWPAMIAAVTDLSGRITGVHRTWLAPDGSDKAPVTTPRKAMGDLLGSTVRIGEPDSVMAAGEGIETMLSLRQVLLDMAIAPALSAAHLAAILFPPALRRLYIVRDNDPAGDAAQDMLMERANAEGIEAICLSPALADFNEDLQRLGMDALRTGVRLQLAPEDVLRFTSLPQ